MTRARRAIYVRMKSQRMLCGLMAVMLLAPASLMALSSAKIGTAALISPANANGYYSPDTFSPSSTGVSQPQEIIELARALGNDVDAIYDFVRNNIDTVWMYGLQKGAVGALVDRSGTPFDQAQLMVELLRQAGYTASYQRGTISLNPTQFSDWTGITDATAACQLLSSGGIPASINGSTNTSCASITGSVSTVIMSHAWVSVIISGTTYVFDPSYKPYSFKSGAVLTTTAGLTSGETLTQATSGMTTGTQSGVSYVRSLNATALGAKITTYANNLQTYIQSSIVADKTKYGDIRDLIGGREIVRYTPTPPATGLRQTALPYIDPLSSTVTWTGNVPDKYRTKLRVQVTRGNFGTPTYVTAVDKTLFVDEIAGRLLIYDALFIPSQIGTSCVVPSVSNLNLVAESGTTATLASYSVAATNGGCNSRYNNGEATLTVNHPYASAADGSTTLAGNYMDAVTVKRVWYATPMIILNAWGDARRGALDKWSDRPETELPSAQPHGCETCLSEYVSSAGDGRRISLAASWVVQSSLAARLHADIAKSIYSLHHVIGVVTGDTEVPFQRIDDGEGYSHYEYQVAENFDRIDAEMAYSVTSKTANAINRRAAVHAIAATVEMLEGGAAGQAGDLPDVVSTPTRFEWANQPPAAEDPSIPGGGSVGARRFYEFNLGNASNATTLKTSFIKNEGQFDVTDTGIHSKADPTIGSVENTARRQALATAISDYAIAGFTVIAAEDSLLGPGQRGGSFKRVGTTTAYTHEMSKQRGGAFVATRYAGSDPIEIAHVAVSGASFGEVVAIKGGGGGTQPNQQSVYDPSRQLTLSGRDSSTGRGSLGSTCRQAPCRTRARSVSRSVAGDFRLS